MLLVAEGRREVGLGLSRGRQGGRVEMGERGSRHKEDLGREEVERSDSEGNLQIDMQLEGCLVLYFSFMSKSIRLPNYKHVS